MISASALIRNCGFARKLNREKPRTEAQQLSMDRGTKFHKAVELWLSGNGLPTCPEDLEIQGWLDLLVFEMEARVGMETEVAWGLSTEGRYLEVTEPQPHVYVAGHPKDVLLTAGRADLVWRDANHVRVIDWKTGRYPATPAQDNLQVHAAGIAMAGRFLLPLYQPILYYARDGYWDYGPLVEIGGREHARMLAEIRSAAQLDETPRPGNWCLKCWERKACPHAQQEAAEATT